LLSKAVQLVIDSRRKDPDEICVDISINRRVIESLCNLPPGTLEPRAMRELSPTLK